MASNIEHQINKPKTQRGRRFLNKRRPQLIEHDKQTLIIKGAHTSEVVNNFLTDLQLLKKPLANKLKWKNKVLPFEDASFIERMCEKHDCALFAFGLHSKKRPHNIVLGRMHDHEILDMHELGIENYVSMRSVDLKVALGAKPVLIFSGDAFIDSEENQRLKSLLIDLFRGPNVQRVNTSGLEYLIHFIMPTPEKLLMRVSKVNLVPLKKEENKVDAMETQPVPIESFQTPWGSYVKLDIQEAAPQVDFVLRRRKIPSEEKWKRAMRVPAQLRPKKDKATKNRSVDVFGSKVAQVHLEREKALDGLRPGPSMRTALTGHTKRGFERQQPKGVKRGAEDAAVSRKAAKRQKIDE